MRRHEALILFIGLGSLVLFFFQACGDGFKTNGSFNIGLASEGLSLPPSPTPSSVPTPSPSPIPTGPLGPQMGINKFDLSMQYLGTVSGGSGEPAYRSITQAMARKAMVDGRAMGATFFRVSAPGFGPTSASDRSDLSLWLRDPQQYWTYIDLMYSDLAKHGMRIVPVLFWSWNQFIWMSNPQSLKTADPEILKIFTAESLKSEKLETLKDMITDSKAETRVIRLFRKYISDYVTRYKGTPVIQFWELTNELNLLTDLDMEKRCLENSPEICSITGNISTSQMIGFLERTASFIRSIDPTRKISSGLSLPRNSASHLERQPEWTVAGADWTADTQTEFEQHFKAINSCCEIVSIHHYWTLDVDRTRFGKSDGALVELINSIVKAWNKELFVGEWGSQEVEKDPNLIPMLQSISKVPYSAPWIFEFYPFSLTEVSDFHIEPGYSDIFIGEYLKIAKERNFPGALPPADPSLMKKPQIILTWPLASSRLDLDQRIYAVASSAVGLRSIEFYIDGQIIPNIGSSSKPPFQAKLLTSSLSPGAHRICAKVMTTDNQTAQSCADTLKP